jgi:hypothetical protein
MILLCPIIRGTSLLVIPFWKKHLKRLKKQVILVVVQKKRPKKINELQRTQAHAERERTTAQSFYSSLPEDAHIGNQQLREVLILQEQLKQDPRISLTEKEKSMIQRAEKYQHYKNKFYQDNPDIDRD